MIQTEENVRNLSASERRILQKKAAAFLKTIPPVEKDESGYLSEKGTMQVQKCFENILRAHRAVGGCMTLVYPDGTEKIFLSYQPLLEEKGWQVVYHKQENILANQ